MRRHKIKNHILLKTKNLYVIDGEKSALKLERFVSRSVHTTRSRCPAILVYNFRRLGYSKSAWGRSVMYSRGPESNSGPVASDPAKVVVRFLPIKIHRNLSSNLAAAAQKLLQ